MLKIYIGPNGYGKTYELERIKKSLFDENNDRKDVIMLGTELVFADEMKDTVNNSFLMDYIITELLVDDELTSIQKQFENKLDCLIKDNSDMYNELMDETLDLNSHKRTKDVIAPQKTREYKKLVKINADDLKGSMGSGQKLHFLLRLIEKSNKQYILLDEPENHSHPSMLNITTNLINKLSETKDVYIATHSPELLNMLNIDFNNLCIFNDSEYKGPKKIDFKKAANFLPNTINIDNLYSNSKTYYDEEKLKANILEIHKKEFMNALFSTKVYIVEGINDQLFLKKLLTKAGKQFEQYSIFPCYGKPHYFPFIEIFKDLGIDVVLLFDEDKTSDETNNKINTELQKNKYYMFNEILEKAFGEEYSKDRLGERLYLSRQIVFRPMPQKSIFEEYSRTNKPHKGIYGLYLYYCYLLGVFPKKHPKQYLPYSIRKEVYKLEQFSQQVRFMHEKNIVTKEDLDNFAKNNSDELSELKEKIFGKNIIKQRLKINKIKYLLK